MGNFKYNVELARREFEERGYIPLFDEYINSKSKLLAMTKEGYKFYMSIDNLKSGKNANPFSNKNEFYLENVQTLINNQGLDLTVIEKVFKDGKTYAKCKCNIHNIEFLTRAGDLRKGKGCKICGHKKGCDKQRLTLTEINNMLKEKTDTIEIISKEYINNAEPLECKCKICDFEFSRSWASLQKCYTCPNCIGSHGEKAIINYLEGNNIPYKYQYRFEDCKDKRTLPFDFYLPQYNLCIEYDGQLHYESARYIKDEEIMDMKLQKQQEHDNIKTNYCKDKNIKLLRIPYWEFDNIENILEDTLNKCSLLLFYNKFNMTIPSQA